jgi:hypothetical protein
MRHHAASLLFACLCQRFIDRRGDGHADNAADKGSYKLRPCEHQTQYGGLFFSQAERRQHQLYDNGEKNGDLKACGGCGGEIRQEFAFDARLACGFLYITAKEPI